MRFYSPRDGFADTVITPRATPRTPAHKTRQQSSDTSHRRRTDRYTPPSFLFDGIALAIIATVFAALVLKGVI